MLSNKIYSNASSNCEIDNKPMIKKSCKSKRKEDIPWSFEEEYLFFEFHKQFGNKWKRYAIYFPTKTPTEMKNHYHACIIKSVRRIMNDKIDNNIQDLMRCFYAREDLLLKMAKHNISSVHSKSSNDKHKKRYKFNPKELIKNGKLTKENLCYYIPKLIDVLLKNEVVKSLTTELKMNTSNITQDEIGTIFFLIFKRCLLTKGVAYLNSTHNDVDNDNIITLGINSDNYMNNTLHISQTEREQLKEFIFHNHSLILFFDIDNNTNTQKK